MLAFRRPSTRPSARRALTLLAFAALAAAPALRAADPAPFSLLDVSNDPASLRARQERDAAFRLLAEPAARQESAAPASADSQPAAAAAFAPAFFGPAAPASAFGSNLNGTGAQPNAVLVPPGDNNYSRGRAVATSGGTAVVASNANANVLNSSVFVYQGVGTATGTVSQSAQLTSADGQAGSAGDNFGISLSLSGGLGIVGAPAFSSSSTGYQPKVYVYNNLTTATGTVTESAQLRPSDTTSGFSQFGFSTSLSGTSGLVGSYQATIPSSFYVGEAYLYRNLNTASGTITENVRLTPSDQAANGTLASGGRFGFAVSLSGNTGLVGAPFTAVNGSSYVGAAYVFRNLNTASGTVTESVKLTPSDGVAGSGTTTGSQFGTSVSQSGNIALAGAPNGSASNASGAAYVFRNLDTATGTVTQNVKLTASDGVSNDRLGFSVGLSGTTALVGAPQTINGSASPQGAAYLYRNLDTATGTVTQNVKLFATNGAANDRFGYSISVDGDRFVIGAPQGQTSQTGQSYSGSLGSVSTLDLGNTAALISGVSFVSQDNWVVGQNTSGNRVTLTPGNTASVAATGKGIYVGQNAGSSNNLLLIQSSVTTNTVTVGSAGGTTGNVFQIANDGGSTTAGTVSAPGGVTLNSGGTLLLSGSSAVTSRFTSTAPVTINSGGRFATGGLSQGSPGTGAAAGVGALTLAGGAGIDFAAGANGSTLSAQSLAVNGTGTITISNWTGSVLADNGAAGNDRLLFVNLPVLTPLQLAQFQFVSDTSISYGPGAALILYNGFEELVPTTVVPEPATWLGGALLGGLALAGARRRRIAASA